MIQWRESLAIGVEEIDNQHKELLKRFNSLLSACEEGQGVAKLKELLGFLDDYVVTHFTAEEKLQETCGYPGFEEHKKLHDSFIERISEIHNEVLIEGVSVHHVLETNNILLKWLINHISVEDRRIGKFLNEKK